MKFILIEDDNNICEDYKDYFFNRDDIDLVSVTNSSDQGIKDVTTHLPDAVILDIELNSGQGSGMQFLEDLKNLDLDFKPLISVTTHIPNPDTHRHMHFSGANFVISKLREDFSPELVVRDLFLMQKTRCNIRTAAATRASNVESIGERKKRISKRIDAELNKYAMGIHLIGRKYLHASILYDVMEEQKVHKLTASQYLAKDNNKTFSNIGNNMKSALEHAWDKTSPEDLKINYPVNSNYDSCVPTPTEFISFYSSKIKASI